MTTACPHPSLTEVQFLYACYASYLDAGCYRRWGELFTHDAVLFARGNELRGRKAILERVRGTSTEGTERGGMHLVGNVIPEVDGNVPRAKADFVHFALPPRADAGQVTIAGGYCDEFRYEDGAWRISRHEIVARFERVDPTA